VVAAIVVKRLGDVAVIRPTNGMGRMALAECLPDSFSFRWADVSSDQLAALVLDLAGQGVAVEFAEDLEARMCQDGIRVVVTAADFGPLVAETFETIEEAERRVDERFMSDDFFTGAAIDIIWRADGAQVEYRRRRGTSFVGRAVPADRFAV